MATCANQEIHVGDIGTAFEVTLEDCDGVVNLTGATVLEYTFTDPSGASSVKTAALVTDGTDGKVVYNLVDGDLPTSGMWKLQVRVVLPTGTWYSNIEKFRVHDNL